MNAGSIAAHDQACSLRDWRRADQPEHRHHRRHRGRVSDYGGSTVVNYGSILSSTAAAFHQGVDLGQNSLLINHTAGIIAGYFGVALDGASTAVNYGTIVGGEKGVQLFEGGTLTNQSGGTIEANIFGVWATGPATVVNAGSIAGNRTAFISRKATSPTSQPASSAAASS